ncbi:MAG: TPM domain-containing protein [Nitrospirae bacterium]|nr:MAG: TPM domain-containing protein [Nitrospirota bacterium]
MQEWSRLNGKPACDRCVRILNEKPGLRWLWSRSIHSRLTRRRRHGILLLAAVEKHQAAVTLGRSMIAFIPPSVLSKIASQYLDPAFRNGRYGEGLYRAAVALASAAQEIRVGSPPRARMKGLGLWLTIISFAGALAFLWWISRPDLRHPFGRIHKGEFWGSGQGGFRGNFGGFGGLTGSDGWG